MKNLKLSSFILKLIALLTMTLDHLGLMMIAYSSSQETMYLIGYLFRLIGRFAFPLFILFLVEGLIHSSNQKKYLLRLTIMLFSMMLVQIILYYSYTKDVGINPFIDLVINGLFIYLITKKDWKKYLAILPLFYVLFITTIDIISLNNVNCIFVSFPPYLKMGYSLFGFLITIAFYFSYDLGKKLILAKEFLNEDVSIKELSKIPNYRFLVNALMAISLFIFNVVIWFMASLHYSLDLYFAQLQTWSFFAGLFILFYNGQKGYDKKWFQIFTYLYFPIHIALISLIFIILF